MSENKESMHFDVVIVGAGPSGLSTAIKLATLAKEANKHLDICVLEKGQSIGAHNLSGATFEPNILDELIPNWKETNHPLKTKAKSDEFIFLTKNFGFNMPIAPSMKNEENYIISIGELCVWLANHAENLGVQIFPGFAGYKPVYNDKNEVIGVSTNDLGVDKNNNKKATFQPGIELLAKYTILAEGCRGSISQEIIKNYNLNKNSDPQVYGLGIKELWEIPEDLHKPGHIIHTLGWPLNTKTYGGGFFYHYGKNLLAAGLVIGLDYENPYINPFKEFQRLKHHPRLKNLFENSKRIAYGARTLNEGGLQSIPQLYFKGGILVGCTAGFVNTAKIKGIHTAIKSGILAANNVFDAIVNVKANIEITQNQQTQPNLNEEKLTADQKVQNNSKDLYQSSNINLQINTATSNNTNLSELTNYQIDIYNSEIYKELYLSRNIRPGFKYGLFVGMFNAGIDTYLFRGKAPWTLHHKHDHKHIKPINKFRPIKYPKPDGKISYDILTSVSLSGTNHEENQPCHVKFKNDSAKIDVNFNKYGSPEQRYCPAKVYEIINSADNIPLLEVNFTNCLHCKACEIKDPTQNITWTPPEGSGPKYSNM